MPSAVQPFAFAIVPSCSSRWSSAAPPVGDDLTAELKSTLEKLIRQDRIVVFLTGTPQRPRCRFTAAMTDLLGQLGIKYTYVDIMEDDEVCEGLKSFSSWPTYPQLYIDGELIGGYDITKELVLSGKFTQMLRDKKLM